MVQQIKIKNLLSILFSLRIFTYTLRVVSSLTDPIVTKTKWKEKSQSDEVKIKYFFIYYNSLLFSSSPLFHAQTTTLTLLHTTYISSSFAVVYSAFLLHECKLHIVREAKKVLKTIYGRLWSVNLCAMLSQSLEDILWSNASSRISHFFWKGQEGGEIASTINC